MHWRSRPITNVIDGANYPRGISLYQMALYSTSILVKTDGGQAWFDMKLQQVGYKKVRTLSFD